MLVRDFSRKDVLTDDGHKLGQTVNLLVDLYHGDTELVVFPHLITKLVRDHAGNISGQITGAAISTLKQFIPGVELAEMAIDQAGGYAGMRASGKVKTMMNVVQESYYVVPLRLVRKAAEAKRSGVEAEKEKEEQLVLNIDYGDCKKWCLNVIPIPERQVSFYQESEYSGPKKQVPITLNVASIQNKILEDTEGIRTIVKDVFIDDTSRETKGVVVNDPRDGLDRVIRIADLNFRDERITVRARLDSYPRI